ncbi:MAG: hypothetical protein DI538_24910, partial [Azospira oryzae]
VFRKSILGFERSVVNAICRFEYVDWNLGKFLETGDNIHEDIVSVVPGISWRPNAQTVIRLNYRYNWQTDILGNPASKTAGFQFGFSSYF